MGEFVTQITTTVTSFLTGIGAGLNDAASNLFLTADNKLSTIGIVIATVGGLAIAGGLFAWVRSLLRR